MIAARRPLKLRAVLARLASAAFGAGLIIGLYFSGS